MKRRSAVAAALVLLVACSGFTSAFAQLQAKAADVNDDAPSPTTSTSSDAILPPVPRNKLSDAPITNSSESRGAVKAIDCSPQANGTISVTGRGSASASPDVARIRMTVEAREPNAADARAKAAETTQAVLDALSRFPRSDARSSSVSVYAQRDTKDGVTRTTAFEFRQSLVVTLTSPGSDNSKKDSKGGSNETNSDTLASLASKALDAAIAAGGDGLSVDSLDFELAPERAAEAVKLARSRALVDLREKAERDASSLGLTLGAIQTARVDPYPRSGEPRPFGSASAAMAGSPVAKSGPGTPLSSPNSETEVTVEGVYRVCSPS